MTAVTKETYAARQWHFSQNWTAFSNYKLTNKAQKGSTENFSNLATFLVVLWLWKKLCSMWGDNRGSSEAEYEQIQRQSETELT